ncbi:MAG: hypothetical protein HPY83_03125 [Anaerolineae bacterium]|nr:hypothetical protein [Anaerolineae bacterium]
MLRKGGPAEAIALMKTVQPLVRILSPGVNVGPFDVAVMEMEFESLSAQEASSQDEVHEASVDESKLKLNDLLAPPGASEVWQVEQDSP